MDFQKGMKVLLVRGWQVAEANIGYAAVSLGVDGQGPNGESAMIPGPAFVLSKQHCRELAQSLLEMAEKLDQAPDRRQ